MSKSSELNVIQVKGPLDVLYKHYPGEESAQDVRLCLDLETGNLWLEYNPEIGPKVPERYERGVVRCFSHGVIPDRDAANEMLEDEEILEMARRILSGSRVKRDGPDIVGVLNEDAEAEEEILADHVEVTSYGLEFMDEKCPDCGELRVYWGDGVGIDNVFRHCACGEDYID